MADEEKKLIVDDDWKSQVEREKEEMKAQPDEDPAQRGPSEIPAPTFLNHIASLATQVMVMLGLVEHPAIGQRTYDPDQARYLIDTLAMIAEKTKGNLTDEEQDYLDRVVPELQMTFVEVGNAVAKGEAEQLAKAAEQGGDASGPGNIIAP